ncbi:DUF4123 domain-containing protein [Herbaspirillum sp. YR522]|uniref:DUF4123 domain-containing protein n=1 Tax=Herbaspirillum sp. YR522 TaxID=1144342 RepID=UPI00026F651E|nr:DUF4123 domain-containing protein [Herbaspirillum sp. YR522]EJN07161.1 hypothetical protein PMI40_01982 [Herbaspirillum sp. YR522]
MAPENALSAWNRQANADDRHRYALLDSAQAEDSHLQLDRWRIRYASLFDGKREESVKEIAPLLIDLKTIRADLRERVLDWLWQLGTDQPCLSWMDSRLPLGPLAQHLKLFHTVGLSDHQTMMLRWYDTRILPMWLECLKPGQHRQFSGVLLSLHCLDRSGTRVTFFEREQPQAPSPAEPALGRPLLQLDDIQFARLMDASHLDMLLHHLQRFVASELDTVPRARLMGFLDGQLKALQAAGIDDADRQVQCLLLALFTSGAGMKHAALEALLRSPPQSPDAFMAAVQALPEEIYKMGVPLWEETRMMSSVASNE